MAGCSKPLKTLSVLLALLIASLLPTVARADLTAAYRRLGSPAVMTVEVAADGSVRVSDEGPDGGYKLWTGGEGYWVLPGAGGPKVMRAADIAAARAAGYPPHPMNAWVPVGEAVVLGKAGVKYKIAGAETNPGASAIVVSPDPALAVLRQAFVHYLDMAEAAFPGETPERRSERTLLATGAPLVLWDEQLETLSEKRIPASRFRLPAAPLSASEVRDYWSSPTSPTPLSRDLERERERLIKRAVFGAGRLWLLGETGALSSVAPGERTRRRETAPATIEDLCVSRGDPVLLARDGATLELLRLAAGVWRAFGTASMQAKETVAALSCTPARSLVLTNRRVLIIDGRARREITLASGLGGPGVTTALLDTGHILYVGVDAGELGGGLVRIDLATGAVSWPAKQGASLCSGPLNPKCDPVNGLAPLPGKPGCVVAAIGLVHMMAHGRLAEVCDDGAVRRLYYKPYTTATSWPPNPVEEPSTTVPFFGVAESHGSLWAVGGDGLYRFDTMGLRSFTPMPVFYDADGVDVSFALPGVALTRTTINAHVSLSGAVPLLAAR